MNTFVMPRQMLSRRWRRSGLMRSTSRSPRWSTRRSGSGGAIKPHSHGWDGVLDGEPGNGFTAAWQWAIVGVAAWLVLLILVPSVLVRLALWLTPAEERQAALQRHLDRRDVPAEHETGRNQSQRR